MHILVKYVYSVCGGGISANSFTFLLTLGYRLCYNIII